MQITFGPLMDLPNYDWFAEDTAGERDAVQLAIDEVKAERASFDAKRKRLTTAAPVDFDRTALEALPRESAALAVKELKLRQRMVDFRPLFSRDRDAEHRAAEKRLQEITAEVTQALIDIGYVVGSPDTPGSILPWMLQRNLRIMAASKHVQDVMASTCHHPENLTAIADLERQLGKMTQTAIG